MLKIKVSKRGIKHVPWKVTKKIVERNKRKPKQMERIPCSQIEIQYWLDSNILHIQAESLLKSFRVEIYNLVLKYLCKCKGPWITKTHWQRATSRTHTSLLFYIRRCFKSWSIVNIISSSLNIIFSSVTIELYTLKRWI